MTEKKVIKNIYQRVQGVMGDVDYIQKGDKKVNNQYRYVSHDQVTGVLHPVLVKHGIVVIPTVVNMEQDGNRTSVQLLMEFVNVDEPQDRISIYSYGYGIDQGDKGPGKGVSYAYKYGLLKVFALETGDDPDHDQAVTHIPEEKKDALDVNEFYTRIREATKNQYSFLAMNDYLKELSKERDMSIEKLMEQALQVPQRFGKSWLDWYSERQKTLSD